MIRWIDPQIGGAICYHPGMFRPVFAPILTMPRFPLLNTERLYLRELLQTDAPALYQIHADPEAMPWHGSDGMRDVREALALVAAYADWRTQANPGTRWAIERRADKRLIGTCGLFKWNRAWASCSVVYELAGDCRGQGFMQEALGAMIDWGFEHMQLNRIEARIHPANRPSLNLAARLGFVEEGLMRQAGFWRGAHHDLLLMARLRQDVAHRSA
jgi:ribosomal-protein-alanine N-acetyltransferase